MITFFAHGEPKAQPRPRAFSRNGKAHVYDAKTAEGWKGQIAIAAMNCRPAKPLEGPISLDILFYFPRPKRLETKKGLSVVYHTDKPDADNCAKAVMDCLTQLGFWKDDAQVVTLRVEKCYAPKDTAAGAKITIEDFDYVTI